MLAAAGLVAADELQPQDLGSSGTAPIGTPSVSTGAAVAVPFFVLGWLRRIPTVYLEVYDRIDSPTLTGRLCRPFARLFCVQWEEQRKFYPGSVVVGPLL